MYVGRRYRLWQTLRWSRSEALWPLLWASVATAAYQLAGVHWLVIPSFPVSVIGVAVAFYLGFKNRSAYDRSWEARKIWGSIVNASRSWAYGVRDLVAPNRAQPGAGKPEPEQLKRARAELIDRHVAWLDALRHQLRAPKPWEHPGQPAWRQHVVEYSEDLQTVLQPNLRPEECRAACASTNAAALLLSYQSRQLAVLRAEGFLDGFGHIHLQGLADELMAAQGKSERIKNFPFPRQYATVNHFFAIAFAALVPLALIAEFARMGEHRVWLAIPFATLVSWVFLTTDKIGDWSENPFEGLPNDVPITAMARGIERDVRQILHQSDLPAEAKAVGNILM